MEARLTIRALEGADAAAVWRLRLDGLQQSPEAFSSTAAEHQRTSVGEYWRRLRAGTPDAVVFGAFLRTQLVGMVRVTRETDAPRRHIAMVESLFVRPEARGKGIGRRLVGRSIAQAMSMAGLTSLFLTIATGQDPARRLYLNAGFRRTGVISRSIRVDGRPIEEETMVLDLRSTFEV